MNNKILKYGCNCNLSFDVRCCCWLEDETYDTCKQKTSNVYWRIINDYDLYQKIENKGFNSIKKIIKRTCRLSDSEWKEVRDFYIIDNKN
jgi:hypothetical protein